MYRAKSKGATVKQYNYNAWLSDYLPIHTVNSLF